MMSSGHIGGVWCLVHKINIGPQVSWPYDKIIIILELIPWITSIQNRKVPQKIQFFGSI